MLVIRQPSTRPNDHVRAFQVVVAYGSQRFYAERRLHFSVAWSLAPMPPAATAAPALGGHELSFDQVACKIGERVTVFKLKAG